MSSAEKCDGSGRHIDQASHFDINSSFGHGPCPVCGRLLKLRFADGGRDGFARFLYLPTHNRRLSKRERMGVKV